MRVKEVIGVKKPSKLELETGPQKSLTWNVLFSVEFGDFCR